MDETRPRFEFRVWGKDVDEAATRLRSSAAWSGEPATSRETYVVALARADVNAKIRAGLMDVKALKTVVRDCEQWYPWLKTEFPVSAELVEEILPRLGVAGATTSRRSYGFVEFVDQVVRAEPLLRVVNVEKTRSRYTIDGCLAEVADVTADGRRLRTLAVESEDIDGLVAVRQHLGLEGCENTNYPRALKAVLNLELGDVR